MARKAVPDRRHPRAHEDQESSEATFYNWRKKYNGLTPIRGEASSPGSHACEPDLGDGPRARSACHPSEAARADDHRHVLGLLACDRAAVQLPWRRRRGVLERVCRTIGFPAAIRVDQGSEFVSRDLDLWTYQRNVTLDFFRPGKPTDNAFIESFNRKFRAECLNTHWFSLDDARRKCEVWRRDYNEERPHSAIGNKVPIALVERSAAHGPP